MIDNIDITYILNGIGADINIMKTIFSTLCIFYTNFKITYTKIIFNKEFVGKLICIIISSIISGIFRYYFNYLISMVFTFLTISIIFSKNNLLNGILTTIVSFGINYIAWFVSLCISFIISVNLKIDNNYANLILIIFLHLILIYRVFKLKKLKYGITFLQKRRENEYIDILISNICVIILVIATIMVNGNTTLGKELIPSFMICIIIMFVNIQKSLQLYYKQKLLAQELENTKKELADKTKELQDLEAENIAISKKAHTLDHKQKSLSKKIDEMLMSTEISKDEVAEVRNRLNKIGKDLYKEQTTTELAQTEIPEIDDMLKYMQSECNANKIDFELQLKGNIHYMINNLIAKEDLETLLADHIKNAIIAINHTDNINRSILVRLGQIDGIYSLYIYDSGIEFEKETLEYLGKKPSTTHKDEGGTGMGFMNTFDTLRKCKASLKIDEFNEPRKDNYTKAIIIKFDNKNEFNIISYKKRK